MDMDRTDGRSPTGCSVHHQLNVSCVAFSPDGKFFATGDIGGNVRLYDADTAAATPLYVTPFNFLGVLIFFLGVFDGF